MNTVLPLRTHLIVTASKVRNSAKQLKTELQQLPVEVRERVLEHLRSDIASIKTAILKVNTFEDGPMEYILSIVAFLELMEAPPISSLELTEKWVHLDTENQGFLLALIKANEHNLAYFGSLKYVSETFTDPTAFGKLSLALEAFVLEFFSLLVKADNEVTEAETAAYQDLKSKLKLDYRSLESTTLKNCESQGLDKILEDLDAMIGLPNVKTEIRSLINFVKVNERRKKQGLPLAEISLHSVFVGPPGTGKTTIARLMANAFKAMGILKKGHLIETDRSELVAGYLGQTAIKTKAVLEKALDGVLFIDEAYTLSANDEFGREAIDTILKYMEDNRSRLIVIVAGYENEMAKFLGTNPGLKSRFNKYFHFPSYSTAELLVLFEKIVTKNKFQINEDVKRALAYLISDESIREGGKFGNARYIRNLYEAIIQNQFQRVGTMQSMSDKDLTEIKAVDLPKAS